MFFKSTIILLGLSLLSSVRAAPIQLTKRQQSTTLAWAAACTKAGGSDEQCTSLALPASLALLSLAQPCDQQNAADNMMDLAKTLNNDPDMIKLTQAYAQQPRFSSSSLSNADCQAAPRNSELSAVNIPDATVLGAIPAPSNPDVSNEGTPVVTPDPNPQVPRPKPPAPAPGEIINNEGQPDVTPIANPEAPSPPEAGPAPDEIINNEGVPDVTPVAPGTPTASTVIDPDGDVLQPFVSTNIPFPDSDGPPINNEGAPVVTPIANPEAPSPPEAGPAPGEIINNEGQPSVTPIADPEAPSPPEQGPAPGEIINNEGMPVVTPVAPGTPGFPF